MHKISKRTGKSISPHDLEQEYIDAISRLRIYEKNVLRKNSFNNVESQRDLQDWIEKITGASGKSLAEKSMKIDEIKSMIEANVRQRDEEIKVQKAPRMKLYIDKKEAKANKGIYFGTYKVKRKGKKPITRNYAYDHGKKKQIKIKDAE